MTWITLTLRVTTPLFNQGSTTAAGMPDDSVLRTPALAADPPDDTAIRVPSLRGAMRFWFRALAGATTGPNLKLLAQLESAVFGRASAGPGDTKAASPFQMRTLDQPEISRERRPDFLRGQDGKWIAYLLGPGLIEYNKADRAMDLVRPYAVPGGECTIKLRFGGDPRTAALALASLWLACAYGGLGARVRRGFGGLRIVDAECPAGCPTECRLPEPWDHASIRSPDLDFYDTIKYLWPTSGPVAACMRHLKSLTEEHGHAFAITPWPEGRSPSFPVFSKTHTLAGRSGGKPVSTWERIAGETGEQLRRFRASEEHSGVPYTPKLKTPEWEAVVHGGETRFPAGALGLPVVYKDNYIVNAERDGVDQLRRASPLWLRPIGSGERWRLLSFAFLADFLPSDDGTNVVLRQDRRARKRVTVTNSDVHGMAQQWITKLQGVESFEPGERAFPPTW